MAQSTTEAVESQVKSTLRELNVLFNLQYQTLRHDNLLCFHGICHDVGPANQLAPALVSPYCQNGTVGQYLEALKKNNGRDLHNIKINIIAGIVRGLQHLHNHKVVHGDLKPNNVLISDKGESLLTDFGRSLILESEGFTHTLAVASTRYTAPEILVPISDDHIPKADFRSDIYSFAVTIWEIYTGQKPFANISHPTRVSVVVAQQKRRPDRAGVPDAWWNLLQRCWDQDPRLRPTVEVVVNDPVFR
ncbi:kinase-like protein [Neolentinus lepideus HHB14362 ss-1]|uniref:Kinase-like protein n=1 Tax=Neolentinus lepideus HHB14362 ss-1 TaxID=1314782 RepID=A0A165TKH4_9AGAM|nr:kinase-like protein [Neolentinus lepideus HHB14362 ss-1]